MTEHKKPTKEPFYISSINLIGLFGRYDYSLPNNKNKNKKSTLSELLILYGDNGTGKTTILNLIYRALLPTRTRNAKTYIAKTPFKSLEINFNDGSKVYYLKSDKLVGSFEATVKVKRGSPKTFKLEAADDGAIKSTAENFFELLDALSNLKSVYFFINDKRFFQNSLQQDSTHEERWIRVSDGRYRRVSEDSQSGTERKTTDEVDGAFNRLEAWLKEKILEGSKSGESSADDMLMNLLKSMSQQENRDQKLLDLTKHQERLKEISKRSDTFVSFGLRPALPEKEILAIIKRTRLNIRPTLAGVLNHYLIGFEARLDALQEIRDLIELFLKSANSYLTDKKITYSRDSGFKIILPHNKLLAPRNLSSGERQLMLLLCNTLIARDHRSIFIIDEPELSLNVKWQRNLIKTLQQLTGQTHNQFIFATHSIELIALHYDEVVELSPIDSAFTLS